jgi:pimeloyl-ACP methyl ester carboxylesterase
MTIVMRHPYQPLESSMKTHNFAVFGARISPGIGLALAPALLARGVRKVGATARNPGPVKALQYLLKTAVLGFTLATALFSAHVGAANVVSTGSPPQLPASGQALGDAWRGVPTQTITAGGVTFAYRELGRQNGGTPVVFLTHLAAVLDNWDPRIMDGIAARHHVIAFDNRGIGASSGYPSNSIEEMADDAIAFIKALGLKQTDLLGFSMGGMIAQEIVLKEPALVRKMVIAGTGPAGGEGISTVAGVTFYDMLRGFFTGQDAKQFLFFTRTPKGIAAGKAFLERLKERTENRDAEISVSAFLAQLQALRAWGQKEPVDLSVVKQPVLVVNGDADRMVPTQNTHDLARRLPNSALIIYPDAGHGGMFQFHADFVPSALAFLGQ